MKRKRPNKQKTQFSTLYFSGIGLVIVLLSAFLFIHNYLQYRKIYFDYSPDDFKKHYPVISDDEIYNCMNQIFSHSTDSTDFTKINVFTYENPDVLRDFIDSANDSLLSVADKIHMKQQIHQKSQIWDENQLKNFRCIYPKDKREIKKYVDEDYWVNFKQKFGPGGLHYLSTPVFNRDKNICIIIHLFSAHLLLAGEDILLYKKINGNWQLVYDENLWIS